MSNEPVAWGVPNTRITERQPFMMLLHSTEGCQYPEMLVPLYTHPADDTALLRDVLSFCVSAEDHLAKPYSTECARLITALRERLALSDAALLAPKQGQLKDRGQE